MGDQPIRLSNGTVSVYPTTERKGRAKQLQIILKPSSLELHKSLKDWKNGKSPKHLIELGDLFNISLQNEPNQIKGDCISLMSSEMTYFILPNDTESTLNDWFELLMERIREARSLKVLRPVFREEFFEAAWDINIIKRPKLRKDYAKDEKIDDLAEKLAEIQGRKRLCISATCFLLFKMGVHPSSDPDQPFDKEAYTELPINVISNYGKQERYFFIRVGRCSEIGQGELWMATEGGASATQLHDKISKINQRDAEKRRQQGIVLSVGGLSSRTLKSTLLRQRARENKSKEASKKGLEEGVEEEQQQPQQLVQIVEALPEKKLPAPLPEPIVVPPLNITSPQLNSTRGESSKVTTPKKKVPFADMAFKIGNKFHYNSGSSSTSTAGIFTSNPEYNKDAHDQMSVNAYVQPPPQSSSKSEHQQEMPPPRTLSPRNCYNTIAEDYMSYDAVVDSRKASAAQAYPIRQVSVMSGSESTNNMASAVTAKLTADRPINEGSDYLMMNNGFKIPDEPLRFPMKEARSYVSDISDSNESCYSSAAKRAKRESTSDFGDDPHGHSQRTYSLGSKPPLTTMPIARDLSDLTTLNPTSEEFRIEDIRKRAHSAGSKTWSRGTYRKVTESQDIRNRTNSFGTSSALAALRRQRQPKFVENDDHAVIDFSDGSNKGSMASIDSPLARSRNSSIGVHAPNIRSAAENAVASSNLIVEKLAAIKVEPSPSPRGGYDEFSMSSSTSSSSISKQSSSTNRRGSAPDTTSSSIDSDYVLMPPPGKTSRSTKLKKIPEKGSDTEEFGDMEHNPSSFYDDDDEDMEDLITPKRAYVTGTTVNQGGLEYAVISTSSAGPLSHPAPPASSLPLVQSFAPPLPISTQTSISGGSNSGTPPIGIMIAPSFSTAAASSPKHSSPNQAHCEYTVINPSTNK
jgi:hypothetical protein